MKCCFVKILVFILIVKFAQPFFNLPTSPPLIPISSPSSSLYLHQQYLHLLTSLYLHQHPHLPISSPAISPPPHRAISSPAISPFPGLHFNIFTSTINLTYVSFTDQFKDACLTVFNNNWYNVHDFTPSNLSSNFALIPQVFQIHSSVNSIKAILPFFHLLSF